MIKCYEKWETINHYDSHFLKSEPFVVRKTLTNSEAAQCVDNLMGKMRESNHRVDVSYTTDSSNDFNGNPMKRESIEARLRDFAEAFENIKVGTTHWLLELGMYFFLSQCSLYSQELRTQQISDVDMMSSIPNFMKMIPDLDTINLWINLYHASTTLHYDANHNLLLVIRGKKRVKLLSPTLTEQLKPFSAFCEAPNHSHLTVAELANFISSLTDSQSLVHEIVLCEGDVLFIPEGWWHQVVSDPLTVAINSWFTSGFGKLISHSSEMLPYYVRSVVHAISNPSHSVNCASENDSSHNDHTRKKTRDEMDMSFADFSSSIDQMATGRFTDFHEGSRMFTPSLRRIELLWIPYARQNPSNMETVFNEFTPEQACMFLSNWDELEKCHENANEKFRILLDALPHADEVMRNLLVKNNTWIERKFSKKLNRILGQEN